MDDHAPEDHDLGLSHDLPLLVERQRQPVGRRRILTLLGGVGAAGLGVAGLAACSADPAATSGAPSRPGAPPAGAGGPGAVSQADVGEGEIPEETAGPYPGDGSNGPDVLAESGVVRSDITGSFGTASGVAAGVPLTVRLKVYDLEGDDATALPGAALYLWHCDADGHYSMYDGPAQAENYLRGVQIAGADGRLEFTTIVPGCYAGRWPHMHFEVYPSRADATSAAHRLRTSQLALPEDFCTEVYSGDGYDSSLANLGGVSLAGDGVFGDGHSLQMATISGSASEGWVASLNVPV